MFSQYFKRVPHYKLDKRQYFVSLRIFDNLHERKRKKFHIALSGSDRKRGQTFFSSHKASIRWDAVEFVSRVSLTFSLPGSFLFTFFDFRFQIFSSFLFFLQPEIPILRCCRICLLRLSTLHKYFLLLNLQSELGTHLKQITIKIVMAVP